MIGLAALRPRGLRSYPERLAGDRHGVLDSDWHTSQGQRAQVISRRQDLSLEQRLLGAHSLERTYLRIEHRNAFQMRSDDLHRADRPAVHERRQYRCRLSYESVSRRALNQCRHRSLLSRVEISGCSRSSRDIADVNAA
jgi:hypothetical protein